ncbi:MAG TPA: secondary thiamine-phosphate synthase enzyme YjbQ [Termitinemataceae bacterium]|nr:secondary thiamine-phosphate synthase enzyme YjbQ [Termitinemataceae bacterium]HOM23821.1 secondary thiamine-phosphate synthase enzyme YjbQ [Termitinemataceae bacterium]HPQ00898.1 secondary thiamine-phosphate synthase enzyme YjbQ [Termitinemataceae bacterium]
MIRQISMRLPPFRRGYHLITHLIEQGLEPLMPLPEAGLLNLFIQHTSAALTINENADPTVRGDFETLMNHLVPDGFRGFRHTLEGDDDMSAHIKASLLGQSLTIPIQNGRLALGTWQGIYLCEFRNHGGSRTILVTLYA